MCAYCCWVCIAGSRCGAGGKGWHTPTHTHPHTHTPTQAPNALALCRPPGHHASRDRACGFCIFNNVAIAAKYALDKMGGESRVLIFDWDVHAPQGTQYLIQVWCGWVGG